MKRPVSPFDAAPQTPPPCGLVRAEMEREVRWHLETEDNAAAVSMWRAKALAAEKRVRELEAEIRGIRAEVAFEFARRTTK